LRSGLNLPARIYGTTTIPLVSRARARSRDTCVVSRRAALGGVSKHV
jgi:hypothetical protein